ncbi:hypothetical protein [Rothia nasimurium]|uniref:hypothetical protein n=1 Tax=Rothia nasimurium TaxID=85336 RepID=UPI001D167827|nr:hypothetical protein [Rothia nasimurium]
MHQFIAGERGIQVAGVGGCWALVGGGEFVVGGEAGATASVQILFEYVFEYLLGVEGRYRAEGS